VLDDEQVGAGRELLEQFRRNPEAAEFSRLASDAGRLRKEEEQEQAEWRRRVHNRQRVFPGVRRYGAGPLTYVLIVASVVLAVYSKSVFVDWRNPAEAAACRELLRPLFISFPPEGVTDFLPEVRRGEVWRLLTPMIIHFGIGHILFNMLWLFQLGSMIESAQGSLKFALLVIAFALVSNLVQYEFRGPFFGGMSGVNYGLIGYVWIRGRCDRASGLHLDRESVIMSIVWFFLCFTGWVGPIANYAHAAGLLTGMAWGWISAKIALRNV
jgi:GlpG protein